MRRALGPCPTVLGRSSSAHETSGPSRRSTLRMKDIGGNPAFRARTSSTRGSRRMPCAVKYDAAPDGSIAPQAFVASASHSHVGVPCGAASQVNSSIVRLTTGDERRRSITLAPSGRRGVRAARRGVGSIALLGRINSDVVTVWIPYRKFRRSRIGVCMGLLLEALH
jgi:hypothetical protein